MEGQEFIINNLFKIDELIHKVEPAKNWNDVPEEEFRYLIEGAGLDYDHYDDPELMWNDFKLVYDHATEELTGDEYE